MNDIQRALNHMARQHNQLLNMLVILAPFGWAAKYFSLTHIRAYPMTGDHPRQEGVIPADLETVIGALTLAGYTCHPTIKTPSTSPFEWILDVVLK
jgi:hypothetical protein